MNTTNVRPLVMTENSIVLSIDSQMKTIVKENPIFNKIKDALASHSYDLVAGLVDLATRISKYTKGKFYVLDGLVYVDAEPLPETLSKRLMAFADADLDYSALVKFWDNLKLNPSKRSQEHLYAFLDNAGIPITGDGCFVAYKRVTEDFKDVHTRTFDNTIGAVVRMKREDVDDDPNMTCSRGLHVAAYPYAKDFYANGKLVEVKVNPKDVVAVPADYNGQKMRVCEYTVLRECEGLREEVLYTSEYYDDTADEDVWDDTIDLDNLDDDLIDDLDDDFDDFDDLDNDLDGGDLDNDDDDNVEGIEDGYTEGIDIDSRGRLGVPKKFMESIGAYQGSIVYANANDVGRFIELSLSKTNDDDRAYTVDKDGAVRVTSYVLGLAGLDNEDSLNVELDGNFIVIS